MSRWKTINRTSKETGLAPYTLRQMQKRGQLPGFMTGNRFMVDVETLLESLDQTSRAAMTNAPTEVIK